MIREHGADGTVEVGDGQVDLDAALAVESGLGLLDQFLGEGREGGREGGRGRLMTGRYAMKPPRREVVIKEGGREGGREGVTKDVHCPGRAREGGLGPSS